MKKVFLIVDLQDSKGNHFYSIKYTGVMTRRNIYAQLTQDTGCPEPKYVKVSKFDTVDKTDDWVSIFSGRPYWHISVPNEIGMNDSRIKRGKKHFPRGILKAVNAHVEENERFLATH